MKSEAKPLPQFANPPVCEVAISVQFERLGELRTPHVGLLWEEYKQHGLTRVEEHAPLQPELELFGSEIFSPHFEVTDVPPVPRVWFINAGGTELVQVQQDRFVHNWRRPVGEGDYPRYTSIRKRFVEDLNVFEEFLARNSLGLLRPIQCEITYVNPIPLQDGPSPGRADRILKVVAPPIEMDFLPEPEGIGLRLVYLMHNEEGGPIGRLRVLGDPVLGLDRRPLFMLQLAARGKPEGQTREGIMRFMDRGHEWIVRGFADLTTKEMHERWRKQ